MCSEINPCGKPIDHEHHDQGCYCPECLCPCKFCDCSICTQADCNHNEMTERLTDPDHAWQCAKCGYIYGAN